MTKIETLKGQKTTGEVLLHQLLEEERGKHLKHVAIVMEFDDGSVDVEWSDQGIEDLSLLSDYFKAQVFALILQEGGER